MCEEETGGLLLAENRLNGSKYYAKIDENIYKLLEYKLVVDLHVEILAINKDKAIVGRCSFTLHSKDNKCWNRIGHFVINVYEDYQSKGFGTELISCMHHFIDFVDTSIVEMHKSEVSPPDGNSITLAELKRFYEDRGFAIGYCGANPNSIVHRTKKRISHWQLEFDKRSLCESAHLYSELC